MHKEAIRWLLVLAALVLVAAPKPSLAQNGLQKVNHIVIVMQENHSFDNYFGVLAYAPASPYHAPEQCTRRLSHRTTMLAWTVCRACWTPQDALHCFNSNNDDNGSQVFAFHEHQPMRRAGPESLLVSQPTRRSTIRIPDNTLGPEPQQRVRPSERRDRADRQRRGDAPPTIRRSGFYNQKDIPYYYDLAQKFAISDRHFSSRAGSQRSPTVLTVHGGHLVRPPDHQRHFSSAWKHGLQTDYRNDLRPAR